VPEWLLKLWPIQNGSKPTAADSSSQEHIVEGSRNDYLARLAGVDRRRGASKEGIKCLLLAENSARCDPPLDISEVENIAHSISRYEAPKLSLAGC
jgi:putative DNA primase/helicase